MASAKLVGRSSSLNPFEPIIILPATRTIRTSHERRLRRRSEVLAQVRQLLAHGNITFSMQDLAERNGTSVQNLNKICGTRSDLIELAVKDFAGQQMDSATRSGNYGCSALAFFKFITEEAFEFPGYLRGVLEAMFRYSSVYDGLHKFCSNRLMQTQSNPLMFGSWHRSSSAHRADLTRQLVAISTSATYEWSIGSCTPEQLTDRVDRSARAFLVGLGYNEKDLKVGADMVKDANLKSSIPLGLN